MNACVHMHSHTICTYIHVMHYMDPKFSHTDKKMQLKTLTSLVSFGTDFFFNTLAITENRTLQS
jgi:hypothetical protein